MLAMRTSTLFILVGCFTPALATAESTPSWRLARASQDRKGVFLMNRIAPSTSELYIAKADGSEERSLLGKQSVFEYHAAWSPDGQWITFTTERNGDGQSDLYRIKSPLVDDVEDDLGDVKLGPMIATPALEDAGVLSPNGSLLAYVSTATSHRTNIWLKNLETGLSWNLTDVDGIRGDASDSPDGYFRPAWSPDGNHIVFSSDRNTAWYGHSNGTGWQHTQALSIYSIQIDGTDFRQVATGGNDYCLGSRKFSMDGSRIVFHEMTREGTWLARRPEGVNATSSQIVSVEFPSGTNRVVHTSGVGCRVLPQFIGDSTTKIGYSLKGGPQEGISYTEGTDSILGSMRSPAWSPDGQYVIYEKVSFGPRPMGKPLYSWDDDWEYRFTDTFPALSLQGRLAITQKQLGNSSIVTINADGTEERLIFDSSQTGRVDESLIASGLGGAFQPDWSHDGQWITFGLGAWFEARAQFKAWIYRVRSDGSGYELLTDDSTNAGFPSFSPDGESLVYRAFGVDDYGLRLLNLSSRQVTTLTKERDNLPHFSPDGSKVLFTRRSSNSIKIDVCTMNSDGSNVQVLTTSGANDAHGVWNYDGSRILYSSGMWGFQNEAALYDQSFQQYGCIMSMKPDGSDKEVLTDSLWEDSMPLYIPNKFLDGRKS